MKNCTNTMLAARTRLLRMLFIVGRYNFSLAKPNTKPISCHAGLLKVKTMYSLAVLKSAEGMAANVGCMVACGIRKHTLSATGELYRKHYARITDKAHMHYTACYLLVFFINF